MDANSGSTCIVGRAKGGGRTDVLGRLRASGRQAVAVAMTRYSGPDEGSFPCGRWPEPDLAAASSTLSKPFGTVQLPRVSWVPDLAGLALDDIIWFRRHASDPIDFL